MNNETSLEKEIKDLYIRSGYGRVPKSEIDTLLFHHLLLEFLGQRNFFSINKKDIFNLSLKLKVSEAKIKKLLEDEYLLYHDKKTSIPAAELLAGLIDKTMLTAESVKDGKIQLPVANPVVKSHPPAQL
jgi:hypothetical protein